MPLFGTTTRATAWSGPRRVVLHCGFRKTGTTFIQDVLAANALPDGLAASARDDVTRPWRRAVDEDIAKRSRASARAVRDQGRALRSAIEASPAETFLVSDENLFGADLIAPDGETIFDLAARYLPLLEEAFEGAPIEFVLYTRDMDKWLRSSWGQAVKRKGETRDHADWRAGLPSLDWDSGLAKIRTAIRAPLTVFSMEDDVTAGGLMGQGLFRHIGLTSAQIAAFDTPQSSNNALPAGALELMQQINALGLAPRDRRRVADVVEANGQVFRP
ncbi:hypothetical protein GCM10011415_33740 [Salipiger pallidus]|uniref:Uncharacterized protein n=1 Tax=Salipiger pallidus TaxID=1775170 RepID=A0A8J2ZMR3_9RHOB|nr:hypothetical protein [Salipiger pallidus]GGG81433.1 hypothetical protein GCM10011415_33740 [Salipiger pallidus]